MIERKSSENFIHVKITKLNMYHSEKTKIEYKIREGDIHEKKSFLEGKIYPKLTMNHRKVLSK